MDRDNKINRGAMQIKQTIGDRAQSELSFVMMTDGAESSTESHNLWGVKHDYVHGGSNAVRLRKHEQVT